MKDDYGIGEATRDGGEIVARSKTLLISVTGAPVTGWKFRTWIISHELGGKVSSVYMDLLTALGWVTEVQCPTCAHSSADHDGDDCDKCRMTGRSPCKDEMPDMLAHTRRWIRDARP